MGRPPKQAGRLLRKNRTFRLRDDLDERLKRAAGRSKRSVSEEIEWRLEQSFLRDEANNIAAQLMDMRTKIDALAAERTKDNAIMDRILPHLGLPEMVNR